MSKSRGEKSNKAQNNAQNNEPVHQNVIIPGKFMESDWNDLVEEESKEEFIYDIVNEVADVACNMVFDKIIKQRVQPYAVLCVKEMIMELVGLQFIQRDKEEVMLDHTWMEDDEPCTCIIDSWAQGAVPVVNTRTSVTSIHASEVSTEVSQRVESCQAVSSSEEEGLMLLPSPSSSATSPVNDEVAIMDVAASNGRLDDVRLDDVRLDDNSTPISTIESNEINLVPTPPLHAKSSVSLRKSYKSHTGSLPKFKQISTTPITDDCPKPEVEIDSRKTSAVPPQMIGGLFKNTRGRVPVTKDIVYDENGNVLRVQKINIASLPQHRIRTKFSVLDSTKETHQIARKLKPIKKFGFENKDEKLLSFNNTSSLLHHYHYSRDTTDQLSNVRTPLPPPLMESVEIGQGVLVREGLTSKQGPPPIKACVAGYNEQGDDGEGLLQPVHSATLPKLNFHDIIASAPPTLNTFSRSTRSPVVSMQ